MKRVIYKGFIEDHFDSNHQESNNEILRPEEIEIEEFRDSVIVEEIKINNGIKNRGRSSTLRSDDPDQI